MSDLKRTPLYESHKKLGARIVPFAGYEMPVQYSGGLEETKATRSTCGLFDVSHMGQFSVRGKNHLAAVQSLVTNDLSKLKPGQAQYNMLCNEKGGVIDDLIVYRRSDAETFICVNAGNRAADYDWMKSRLAKDATLTDQSDETALIAVQGPNAEKIVAAISDATLAKNLKYYYATEAKVFGLPCYLSRTGYTGEDGYELYVRASDAVTVWDKLLEAGKPHGLVPCGLGSRDTLRLEMGYPLHGHELSTEITPLEAGLGWVVKLELPTEYVGQRALRELQAKGLKRKLTGFVVKDKRIARQGYEIVDSNGKRVGEITSGTMSPHVGAPVAMGFLDTTVTAPTLFAVIRNENVPMEIKPVPFVPRKIKK